jgi:probable F420-dependent oxidoreductase
MPGIVEQFRSALGRVGVWLSMLKIAPMPIDEERREMARLDEIGYRSIWAGEYIGGREAFAHSATVLASTKQAIVGLGVANIWARHPAAMQGGAATLAEAFPGRFAIAVGISTPLLVERHGMTFGRPLERITSYLDGMDAEANKPGAPSASFPRLLGALGPAMLGLARDRLDGAHPYFVPVEHTAQARQILGPDKLLIPEVAVVLDSDDRRAAEISRATYLGPGLQLPNSAYVSNLRRLGYADDDLSGAGSDRLLDALVAHGDEARVVAHLRAHLEAGADAVLVQPLGADLGSCIDQLKQLAPALLEL